MSVAGQGGLSRIAGRTVAAAVIGWAVVYSVLRIQGDEPDQAAWPALVIGGTAGVVLYLAGLAIVRRVRGQEPARVAQAVPGPGRLSEDQRETLRIAAFALAALALSALLIGAVELGDWIGTTPDDRGVTPLVLGGWNVLFALWCGDVAQRAWRMDGEDLDSIPLGAALTAVLAGLGISRGLFVPGQVALAAVAGVCGAVVGLAAWRVAGSRGAPVVAIVAFGVAVLAIALPLAAR